MNPTLLLSVALITGAPQLKAKPAKVPPIVGEWVAESVTIGGEVTPQSGENALVYVFTKNGDWIIRRGDKALKTTPDRFTVDLGKTPHEIDLGSDKINPDTLRLRGIFRIEGDRLTLCYSPRNSDRPTQFESPAGSQTVLWFFHRKRPKD